MKPDLRFIETIDRLIGNIPAACYILIEEGHVNLAGQLERDQHNLVHWRKQLGDPLETVTCIPFPIVQSIRTALLKALDVEIPWSGDPLEMAHTAIRRQKIDIAQVLDSITKHCFSLPPAEPEEPEP